MIYKGDSYRCMPFIILVPCRLGYSSVCNSSQSYGDKTAICPASYVVKMISKRQRLGIFLATLYFLNPKSQAQSPKRKRKGHKQITVQSKSPHGHRLKS